MTKPTRIMGAEMNAVGDGQQLGLIGPMVGAVTWLGAFIAGWVALVIWPNGVINYVIWGVYMFVIVGPVAMFAIGCAVTAINEKNEAP